MFDELVAAAAAAADPADAVAAWARVENAAAARRLSASADALYAQMAVGDAEEREQWCLDNWDLVCAELGAAQNISLGVASHQMLLAQALRERLPRVAEVFASGSISLRMINTIVYRTGLINDDEVMAKVDGEIADAVSGWGPLSVAKLENTIDTFVDRHDPGALRHTETAARDRHVTITPARDGRGYCHLEATLVATDGDALDQRLDAMARAVCVGDPRTADQRRNDALAALTHGNTHLACGCGSADCDAAQQQPSSVVVHVIADKRSLSDNTAASFDGVREDEAAEPDVTPKSPPALILGNGLLPAPLLAEKIAPTAKIQPIVHPGDAPPEPRYIPTAVLAWFIRARDLTCRFPGCDAPAHRCDLDHTIPYPLGPTQASNLKCLCRKHHLLKTFGKWRDEQHPDGTVVWTSPRGQTYTTHPGSRLLFPTLCEPTAPVATTTASRTDADRTRKMPRRARTRAQDRTQRVAAERRLNDDLVATHNKPPPF